MRSVLAQGYPNLEYIVIDGGSTDGSVQLLQKYAPHLSYWVSEKDRGAADALRKGFARCTGSILAYLNSDDVYLPGALNRIALAMTESIDVVYGNTYWVGTDGERLGERRQTPFQAQGYLYGGFDMQQPSTFWTRAIYEQAGGIDPEFSFAFDTDLFFRFVACGARFEHLQRFIASFRIHPDSKSSTQLDRCRAELERLRARHLKHPFRSVTASLIRNHARAQRALDYATQGELGWLLQRVPDRWSSRQSTEIAGPRAKWI